MELSNIIFEYKSEGKSAMFYIINMDFNKIISSRKSKNKIIDKAESSLNKLENVLDDFYTKENYRKEEINKITPNDIKSGYLFKGNSCSSNLCYKIPLSVNGKPADLKLNLFNYLNSLNSKNKNNKVLDIFDFVLNYINQENISISEEAQRQIDNIDYLRNKGFDLNKYLKV